MTYIASAFCAGVPGSCSRDGIGGKAQVMAGDAGTGIVAAGRWDRGIVGDLG